MIIKLYYFFDIKSSIFTDLDIKIHVFILLCEGGSVFP